MEITRKQVITYALLPGILPRLAALFTSGFSFAAYLIAYIYRAVRLLPPNHPYIQPHNIGKYGIRHVIGEAANHLTLKPQNIDQIIVFAGILTAIALLFSQIILLIGAFLTYQPAIAQSLNAADIFSRPPDKNAQDIAMILLDRVFGISNIFGSCISESGITCLGLNGQPVPTPSSFPFPFHKAFHQMLKLYSYGMFFIGAFVIIYFLIAIVAETAQSGSPLGQRFNKTWVPVRLILFFALLIPIGTGNHDGINAAQFITFRIAKGGSNMASNAWENFNKDVTGKHLAGKEDLIATPNIPELDSLPRFIFIAKTCKIVEETLRQIPGDERYGPDGIQAWLVRPKPFFTSARPGPDAIQFTAFGGISGANFTDAVKHSDKGKIEIRFGSHLTDTQHDYYNEHAHKTANTRPICGSISMDISNVNDEDSAAYKIQALYYDMVKKLWEDPQITKYAICHTDRNIIGIEGTDPNCTDTINTGAITDIVKDLRKEFSKNMRDLIIAESKEVGRWSVPPELAQKGWAGAAIWYNQIAELNGDISGAVFNLPSITAYPFVMETVATKKRRSEENPVLENIFNPQIRGNETIKFSDKNSNIIAPILYKAYKISNITSNYTRQTASSNNPLIKTIDMVFGTNGIYDLLNNPDINPLAQLSALGKGMMNASIRNIAMGAAGKLGKNLADKLPFGQLVGVAASFSMKVGLSMLAMSFVLYYILPLLPFLFFFFAVGGWIKSIFEAIVAMPLWALAHIMNWGGENLPGPFAVNGYMLLFEIMIRPILILFGLIAGILTFSALVMVLNDIFALVIQNVGGFNTEAEAKGLITGLQSFLRGPVDEFFYTVLYTLMCYILATSSFKLIDLIPNQILRYMSFTTPTFQENTKGAAEDIAKKTYTGVLLGTNDLSGGQISGLIGSGTGW